MLREPICCTKSQRMGPTMPSGCDLSDFCGAMPCEKPTTFEYAVMCLQYLSLVSGHSADCFRSDFGE